MRVVFVCSVLCCFLLPDSLYFLDNVLFKREVTNSKRQTLESVRFYSVCYTGIADSIDGISY